MPTMSEESVKVFPRQALSTMTLDEVREAMLAKPPKLDGFIGGWASTTNENSNLRSVGVAPPTSSPVILPAIDGMLPEILKARFYYWEAPPTGQRDESIYDPLTTRKLNAIDVMVTKPSSSHVGFLFSTRTTSYLNRKGGVVASLNEILQQQNATTKIDRARSHLELADSDFFLWVTVQMRDKPQLSSDLLLDLVSGISSRDQALRTADLRSSVDFDRPNFLTAVAETDTLGPIDICFKQHVGEDNHSYEVKIHVDGGFELRKNAVRLADELDRENAMEDTCILLAFSLIPRINNLYVADAAAWKTRKVVVIEEAMAALKKRYKRLQKALQSRLAAPTS